MFPALTAAAVEAYLDCALNGQTQVVSTWDAMLGRLIHCYAAGFEFLNKRFCLGVMRAVIETCNKTNDVPRAKELRMVYDMPGCCALRKLIMRIWMLWSSRGLLCFREEGDLVPEGFQADLERIKDREPFVFWYEMPVAGPLNVEKILSGLTAAVDRDLVAAATKRGQNEGSDIR